MPFSKVAHAAATEKVAAAESTEIPDAIRAGFVQAGLDMGLNPEHIAKLGKFASIVLEASKPTKGYAKIAADFSPADTVSADPGEIAFRKQLEAQQAKRAPVAPAAPVVPAKPPVGPGGQGLFEGMNGPDMNPPPKGLPPAPLPKPGPMKPMVPQKPVVPTKPVVPPSPAPPIVPGGKP